MWQSIKQKYQEKVLPARAELFGVQNVMAVPRLTKVVLNARLRRGGQVTEEILINTLERITGQKPVVTKAKKSISNFKIRQGMPVGVKVTLRGQRLIDFLDKFINVVLPRVRDFNGLSTKILDGQGNATIGLVEHMVFPEVASDDMTKTHGLEICITTTAKNNKDALTLFRELGFPFKVNETKEAKAPRKKSKKTRKEEK
ncbi:MAG: 50S ribosomal protein L5, partial [Candidatus Komeilibacteria bacterium]|nr:50S ribosomal protein L5 [Candidatus Komeilibacteria bacterium]